MKFIYRINKEIIKIAGNPCKVFSFGILNFKIINKALFLNFRVYKTVYLFPSIGTIPLGVFNLSGKVLCSMHFFDHHFSKEFKSCYF